MPQKRLNLAGEKFGKWTVIQFAHMKHSSYWLCRCECGNESVVLGSALKNGRSSCCSDCNPGNTKHGMKGTPEYKTWLWMKRRCNSPTQAIKDYPFYGGRGIKVCERWENSFDAFYNDMGKRPSKKHTLDRIDNDGPYSPENCRWVTRKKQANNRRNNVNITFSGQTMTVAQWARVIGISENTLRSRLYHNWPIERALTEPPRKITPRK